MSNSDAVAPENYIINGEINITYYYVLFLKYIDIHTRKHDH